jgi:hypothetical protein
MSNPKNKITPEALLETKKRIRDLLQIICQNEGIRIVDWQKGIIEKATY